jgi:hypothetical protein
MFKLTLALVNQILKPANLNQKNSNKYIVKIIKKENTINFLIILNQITIRKI